MAEKSPGIWAIAIVAVAGMLHVGPQFTRQTTTNSSGTGGKNKPAGLQSTTAYGCDPDRDDCAQKLLSEFYGINQTADIGSSTEDAKIRFRESESQILIAAVTDPLDAHASSN